MAIALVLGSSVNTMNLCNETLTQSEATRWQQPSPNFGSEPVCLWLVDDHEEIRDLLAELLVTNDRINCSRRFSSAEAMLDALARETAPDVILTDVNMGGMSGIDSIPLVRALASSTRVVVMTTVHDKKKAVRARELGASNFLSKGQDVDLTIEAILNAVAEPVPTVALTAGGVNSASMETDQAPYVITPGDQDNALDSLRSASVGTPRKTTPLLARAFTLFRSISARNRRHQQATTSFTCVSREMGLSPR
ncbi:MAG: transcriptional regulator [Pedosphaera sp.]|nr:transcriptional regulator [Pedosphaera sp.]